MQGRSFRVASPQDFAAGLFLVAVGVGAWLAAGDLSMGTLRAMGPGMLPKSLAVLLVALGVLLVLQSLRVRGPSLEAWSWRGLLFVMLGVGLFALTIRGGSLFGITVPALGLVIAGPLVAIVSAFASSETRIKETLIFGLVMTAFCVALFKYGLGLPIPLAPWWLGY